MQIMCNGRSLRGINLFYLEDDNDDDDDDDDDENDGNDGIAS